MSDQADKPLDLIHELEQAMGKPDDTPKFVDKRRRGIDRAFFKPLPPTRPEQGTLDFGGRKGKG